MWGQAFSPCSVKLAQMSEISIKSFKLMIIKCSEKEWRTLLNGKTETFSKVKYIYEPFNITVIQAYAPNSNAEEAEVEWFYEDLHDLL